MSRHYHNPDEERSEWTLPTLEVFRVEGTAFDPRDDASWMGEQIRDYINDSHYAMDSIKPTELSCLQDECAGWYSWTCVPGCLPDSEASGPFETEQEALEAARED